MITEDDARHTRDHGDCYAINPSIALWSNEANPGGGKPVAETFRYASDNNDQWLSADEMRTLIDGLTS